VQLFRVNITATLKEKTHRDVWAECEETAKEKAEGWYMKQLDEELNLLDYECEAEGIELGD